MHGRLIPAIQKGKIMTHEEITEEAKANDAGSPNGQAEAPYLGRVDVVPNRATHADEMQILTDLYGEMNEDGLFVGDPLYDEGDDDTEGEN